MTHSTPYLVRRAVPLVAALSFTLGAATQTSAAGLELFPTHVNLTPKAHSGTITLRNTDDAPLRVEINASQWKQDDDGKANLSPSDAIVVFPELLTIPAHGEGIVRVATMDPSTAQERAYKVSITEIGNFSGLTRGAGVAIRMQANVPVFLAPTTDRQSGAISDARIQKSAITFSLANIGTSHFITKDVRVMGMRADTRQSFSQELDGTEVLAGAKHEYRIALSRQQCSALRALKIEASAGEQHLIQTIVAAPDACNA